MPSGPYDPPASIWRRFLAGSIVIVVLMATATASAVLLEVNHVSSFFRHNTLGAGALPQITPAQAGAPETILVIGSDKRAKSSIVQDRTSPPHSDTLMLIRMDPNQNQTSVLSIPRDLKVTIDPARGVPQIQKINAAYSLGGAALTAQTIRQTLPGIQINHIVDINFAGFRHVIDAIGCVYVFVDRRYFNRNIGTIATNYASIDIAPGYQRLCGQTALDYARYRHTDSDFVRVARQQDFVRAAKQQISALSLFNHQDRLLSALQQSVETDIHGSAEIAHLFELALFSLGRPIRQVHFQSTPGPSYVTASSAQLQQTINDFLYGNPPAKPAVATHIGRARTRGVSGLYPIPTSDLNAVISMAIGAPLKVYVPRLQVNAGAAVTARHYTLFDEQNRRHFAYVVSIPRGVVGEYYGIEGTDWTNPPILQSPSETRTIGGRTYQLFAEGGKLHVIAWHVGRAVYWINNTLLDSLSNQQMLAIARSVRAVN